MADFAPVFPGWNVWSVYQVNDLGDLNPMTWGLSSERRLQIWTEDNLRAAGAKVADPIDLKGSQVQIIAGRPEGLAVAARKEDVSGPALLLDGASTLRFVRFYNRGEAVQVPWPHDDEYLLNEVFKPSELNPATQGPPPPTIAGGAASGAGEALKPAADALKLAGIALAVVAGLYVVNKLR